MPASKYSDELADEICDLCAKGESLKSLSDLKKYPDHSTIYRWLEKYPYFQSQYIRARAIRADTRAANIDQIVKDAIDGKVDVQAARLAIDTYKWQAGKEAPRVYGDTSLIKLADANGDKLDLEGMLKSLDIVEGEVIPPKLIGSNKTETDG